MKLPPWIGGAAGVVGAEVAERCGSATGGYAGCWVEALPVCVMPSHMLLVPEGGKGSRRAGAKRQMWADGLRLRLGVRGWKGGRGRCILWAAARDGSLLGAWPRVELRRPATESIYGNECYGARG